MKWELSLPSGHFEFLLSLRDYKKRKEKRGRKEKGKKRKEGRKEVR